MISILSSILDIECTAFCTSCRAFKNNFCTHYTHTQGLFKTIIYAIVCNSDDNIEASTKRWYALLYKKLVKTITICWSWLKILWFYDNINIHIVHKDTIGVVRHRASPQAQGQIADCVYLVIVTRSDYSVMLYSIPSDIPV